MIYRFLIAESEQNFLESSSGNVLEDFKNEFCESHFSEIIYEDKNNFLRVVDTTIPKTEPSELQINLEGNCDKILSEEYYDYDLLELEMKLIKNNHYKNHISNDYEHAINDENGEEIKLIETKRRFEFINSDNLAQTEIAFSTPDTGGLGGQNEQNIEKKLKFDHSRLMMPVHQILSVI